MMPISFNRPTLLEKKPSICNRLCKAVIFQAIGIQAVFHYLPLHLSPMGEKYGGKTGDCPVTERVSDQLLRQPFYTNMTQEDQSRVIEALKDFSVQ
jgi:dTDP-4-amino-4,6-dideoxygalactose transaminase